jgi:NADH:ubiquinone oxidoreductase subunit 6 (subunit J)/NADH:ubiquinone oxidoreductase subunit K
MRGGDALFYLLALVALAGALSSALRRDLERAAQSLKTTGAGVAGLLALAGATLAASLLAVVVVAGHVLVSRRQGAGEVSIGGEAVPGGRVRASLLVLAFFVIVARVVLMVRWPAVAGAEVAAVASWVPPVGLPHYLVAALSLFCVGLFAAITRRSGAGVGMGVAVMQAAVTVAVATGAGFAADGSDARLLAASTVLLGCAVAAAAIRVGDRYGDFLHDSDTAQRIAIELSTVLAVVTLAMLAGAW